MAVDWETIALGEVATVRSGYAFKSRDWTESGIPVVKIANVKAGRLEMSGCSFVPSKTAAEASSVELAKGDILIAMTGYIGEVARVRADDLPCLLNQRVGSFSVDVDRLDADYLFSFLRWSATRKTIEGLGYGSAQPNVSPTLVHTVEIPLPPLPEQRAIAHVLGTLDDKIELNRRMNATLEAVARALFRSWFVDFDPVRAKMEGRDTGLPKDIADLFPDRLVASELGEIPEGWSVGSLGDIAEPSGTGVDPTSVERYTPYVGLEHMPRHSVALTDWGSAGSVSSNKSGFSKGDVLFGKLRPYFHKVGIAPVNGVCSTDIVVLTARIPELAAFVLAYVSSPEFISYTNQTSTGTKMPRTSWRSMSRYEVCRPAEPIVEDFQRVAGPMLDRIVANIHESRVLGALRDALLPKLVSGEMHVRVAEKLVGATA